MNSECYVKVSEIQKCLDKKDFAKDDEIRDYAEMLIDWAVSKREIEPSEMIPISVLKQIKEELEESLCGDGYDIGVRFAITKIDAYIDIHTKKNTTYKDLGNGQCKVITDANA